ncbi:MAG TPA: hypothetical protein VGM23_08220 [Armatimonadota bacterium]
MARDAAAFNAIRSVSRAGVKSFDKGKSKKEDLETEFRKYRKDFKLENLEVMVP